MNLLLLLLVVVLTTNAYPDGTAVQLYPCNGSDKQQWEYHPDKTIRLVADGKCLDISAYSTDDGAQIWLFTCHTADNQTAHQNQEFLLKTDNTIVSILSNKCIDAYSTPPDEGTPIQIWPCKPRNSEQTFVYDKQAKTFTNRGFCLDAGSPVPPACLRAQYKNLPFCNTQLSFEARVADILTRIPLAQKIGLFSNNANNIPSVGQGSYEWWSEALHGVAGSPGVRFADPTPAATSFPQIINIGATFDDPLVAAMATAISTEGRGFYSVGNAGLTFWAPNINIIRDPRWGRGQETPGEDPYRTSQYALNFVSNMQGNDPKYLKVSSCCKHYAAYNLENWKGMDRYHFDAIVTEQDLQDTYLPTFKACVQGAHGSSLMCSYNAVNGVPSCANKKLLTFYARESWGFEGYITGDCGAVDCVQSAHQYTNNFDSTCEAVLDAGTDIDCGGFLTSHLATAIADGAVLESDLDRALTNLFMVQFRLGIFDPQHPYSNITVADVNTPAHQELALKAARESMILLKNTNNALPLSTNNIKTLAVVGPNGAVTDVLQGNYYGNAPYVISATAGLSKFAQVTFVKGCDIASTNKSGFAAACTAARNADATILVVGIDQSQESEGKDRDYIELPGVQNDLITQTTACSKGPVIVVVITGGSVDLSVPKALDKVGALLWAGYPGQSGGQAIAETIFGVNNPAGRLPYTIYDANYINQVSMLDMNMRPGKDNPGRTYRFFTGTPVYPFGYGLSYSTWEVNWSTQEKLVVPKEKLDVFSEATDHVYSPWSVPHAAATSVKVTNTGKVAGDYIVLLFVVPPNPGVNGNPLKSLAGYSRLMNVQPGESRVVNFNISVHDLTIINAEGVREVVTGEWVLQVNDISRSLMVEL